jgi:hypothetical protein
MYCRGVVPFQVFSVEQVAVRLSAALQAADGEQDTVHWPGDS